MKLGPIIDGHVEIIEGSGKRWRADGMLSKHPQCDRIRAIARKVTGKDWPDVPVIVDHFCPRHVAYLGEEMLVTNRPGEELEKLVVIDEQTAQAVLDGCKESLCP